MPVAASTPVQLQLAEFTAGLRFGDLPEQVVEKVRCNLLHDLSCALAAHTLGPSVWPAVRGLAPWESGLLCCAERLPAEQAAFANAVMIHGRAQDDTHFSSKCHAGSAVIPAALALAQRHGRSGEQLVTAIVAGYEVMTALGDEFAPPATERGFRASAIFGPLGAAAAAAMLLDLDAEATANAIALATSFSGGLNQTWIDGSTEWRWQPGMSARNGILAARLGAEGAAGAAHAFDGAAGFARAFADDADWTAPDLRLGRDWRILDVIYKPFPVCALLQSPVEAAARLAAAHDLSLAGVAAARLFLNPVDRLYPGTLNWGPFADVGATLMSAPFCVAMALRDRGATLAALRELDDPELMEAVRRIEVLPDDALPSISARLEVDTTGGATHADELIPDAATYNWDWQRVCENAEAMRGEMAVSLDPLREAVRHIDTLASVDPILEATHG